MSAELNANAHADDEVDERDGVEGDLREGHDADDIDEDHDDSNRDDETGE